jgi:integrase
MPSEKSKDMAARHLLTAREVTTLTDGMHKDGGNLFLRVRNGGKARSWVFRYTFNGRQRPPLSLGSVAKLSLADAREEARRCHLLLLARKDPAEARKAEGPAALTVIDALDKYYDAKIAHLSQEYRRKTGRYLDLIRDKIGTMSVAMVTTRIILDEIGLREMWNEKRKKAETLRGHLERTFSLAKVECNLSANPAAWKDNLEHVLSSKRHKSVPHASLDYRDVGRLMADVRAYKNHRRWRPYQPPQPGRPTSGLWLEFVILTGVRISEPRKARWREIDPIEMLWKVPPEHLKTGPLFDKVRAVPITEPMLAVLQEMQRRRTDPSPDAFIFPSPYTGKAYSRNQIGRTLQKILEKIGWKIKITPHGFRATLQAWALANGHEQLLVDRQFDHAPPGKVGQAYSDLTRELAVDPTIERRRKMMEAWGAYCNRIEPKLNAAGLNLLAAPVANKELTT